MTTEKDYSLLHPFDLEAAKAGEKICHLDGDIPRGFFVHNEKLYVEWVCRADIFVQFKSTELSQFRMAPLAWVEGKPVYKGDVVYGLHNSSKYTADSLLWLPEDDNYAPLPFWSKDLTWTPPKVKREGWINLYRENRNGLTARCSHIHRTRDEADENADTTRIDCICIEWEE